MVVENSHFGVLHSSIKRPGQLDKKNGILKGPPEKLAFKMNYRDQKYPLNVPPSSMYHNDPYVEPVPFQMGKKYDATLNIVGDDFDRYKQPETDFVHKMPIPGMPNREKVGLKWGKKA